MKVVVLDANMVFFLLELTKSRVLNGKNGRIIHLYVWKVVKIHK